METPVLGEGATIKLELPLGGVLALVQSPAAAFRPEQRPTQRSFARISVQQRNGRMRDESTETLSDNT